MHHYRMHLYQMHHYQMHLCLFLGLLGSKIANILKYRYINSQNLFNPLLFSIYWLHVYENMYIHTYESYNTDKKHNIHTYIPSH